MRDNPQLPLTGLSPPGRPPGLHVTLRGGLLRILRQPVHRHRVIEGLGQCVHFRQVHRQLGDGLRKQALDGAGNAPELGIALAEVVIPVQLVQEEASRSALHPVREHISVGALETLSLETFDRRHRGVDSVAAGLRAQSVDGGEVGPYAVGGGSLRHGRRSLSPPCTAP